MIRRPFVSAIGVLGRQCIPRRPAATDAPVSTRASHKQPEKILAPGVPQGVRPDAQGCRRPPSSPLALIVEPSCCSSRLRHEGLFPRHAEHHRADPCLPVARGSSWVPR